MRIPEYIEGKVSYVAYSAGGFGLASEQADLLRAAGEQVVLASIAQTFDEAQEICRTEGKYDLVYIQC